MQNGGGEVGFPQKSAFQLLLTHRKVFSGLRYPGDLHPALCPPHPLKPDPLIDPSHSRPGQAGTAASTPAWGSDGDPDASGSSPAGPCCRERRAEAGKARRARQAVKQAPGGPDGETGTGGAGEMSTGEEAPRPG